MRIKAQVAKRLASMVTEFDGSDETSAHCMPFILA